MHHSPSSSLHRDRPVIGSVQKLADRNELAAIAFERTRMPMVVTDPRQADNPIVLANQAFLDLTGYAAEEVVGRNCRFLQGNGSSPVAIAEIRAAVAETREVNVEVLNYRKDGSAFWNKLHISPIHDEQGRLLYFFSSQMDVSALRNVQNLEASEHRLLMEVDHRARNVLAIVDSIVRLSRSNNAALYAAAVQQRVQALARAHNLLAERGWQEVSLEEIIRRQVAPFGAPRIALRGPEVKLSPLVVQPIALIIHELVVNAATHGALSSDGGAVSVEWESMPQHGGFRLQWSESGGPAPVPAPQPGFGTVMANAMVERQLQGRIQRDWRADGLAITITVPRPSQHVLHAEA